MVDGYIPQEELRRREREDAIRREREKRAGAERARALLKSLHQRLKSADAPFDCMVERMRRPYDVKPYARKPGWYLGAHTSHWTHDRGYGEEHKQATTHYALTKRGRLYSNTQGVGERKEFQAWGDDLRSPPGGIAELLEARLAELG